MTLPVLYVSLFMLSSITYRTIKEFQLTDLIFHDVSWIFHITFILFQFYFNYLNAFSFS